MPPGLLLIIIIALFCCHSKLIDSKPEAHLSMQVGAALQHKIPRLFSNYQHSRLQNLTKDQYQLQMQLCSVQLDKSGELDLISSIAYNSSGFTDKQVEDSIIYDIKDLTTFKNFVDAIYYQTKLIALFQFNEIVIYSINITTGILTIQVTTKINEIQMFDDVQLIIFNDYCYIISHEWILNINNKGQYNLILDYQYQQFTIGQAVEIGSMYCVAEGENGLFIYVYDPQTESLQLVRNATFEIKDGIIQTDLAVDEFYFDRQTEQIFILDHEQGLIKTYFSDMYNNTHIVINKNIALMGGCENIGVTSDYIYLTCPELVQLNRSTLLIKNIMLNSFYPYTVNYTKDRIYAFGRQEFAIFDTHGQLIEQHPLGVRAEKSIIIGEYIVTFTNNRVISNRIIPHSDQLYCTTNDITLKGSYHGMYKSYGQCNEYNLSHIDSTEVCFVQYPFTLNITDSAPTSNTLEVALLVVWGVLLFFAAVYCSVKNFILHRGYAEIRNTLVEQQVQQNPQVDKPDEGNSVEHLKQSVKKPKEQPKEEQQEIEQVIE